MSRIEEEIVREYFEQNGFLVRQLRKDLGQTRRKSAEEESELLLYNPAFQSGARKPDFLLFSSSLPAIERAVVLIKGWSSARTSSGLHRSSAQVFRFLEQNVGKRPAEELFAAERDEALGSLVNILVVPGLPTSEPYRSQSIDLLQARGIDGIISLRSMLMEVAENVELKRSYPKVDLLETIRVLKIYDLIKDPQLELFPSDKRR